MPFKARLILSVAICYGHLGYTCAMRGTGEVSRTLNVPHSSYSSILKTNVKQSLERSCRLQVSLQSDGTQTPTQIQTVPMSVQA